MPDTVRDFRRGQIVTAARAIVARDGLDALTFGALEKQLGFTRGVITYHFKNKQEMVQALLANVVEEIDQEASAAVNRQHNPRERVAAVLRAMVNGFVSRVEATRVLVAFWGRVSSDPHVGDINEQLYRRYRAQTARLLRAGVKSGAFPAHDEDALAGVVVGVVLGLAAQAYFDPRGFDVEACVDAATQTVLARLDQRGARATAPARA
jgi:AcrR family transcriptional regulator